MTIEITQPETEALIEQRMTSGAFSNVEAVLLQALKTAPAIPSTEAPQKTLREVFEAVHGLADDLDFSRDPSISRAVDL